MHKIPSIGLISLGCAKNLVDTERLTSVLVSMGYAIEQDYSRCDLIVINTCGFINAAVQESLQTIGEASQFKKNIIVMGCLGARPQVILDQYPQICAVFGPGKRAALLREIVKILGKAPAEAMQKVPHSGVLMTPPHYAYLKIAEGCRHRCTFCIIPSLRGPLRSRLPEDILSEARDLKARRVKELLVIAQDSSDYGVDLPSPVTLSELCREIGELRLWTRVHYVYPSKEATRLVELMAEGLVLPYLDVPLQHASDSVLKRMKRPGTHERTLRVIEDWRKICPDIAIRSTFITGFPGETQAEFDELMAFIREARLDRVGCFPYSDVDGATANAIEPAIDPEVREERAAQLMELQEQISAEKLAARVGKVYDVLIDDVTEHGVAVGRSKYEAPDVDGVITIAQGKSLLPGDLVKVKITGSSVHDMEGELVTSDIKFAGV